MSLPLCFQSLDLFKPCEHPDPPAHRVATSPEQRNQAKVSLQIPIFDRAHFVAKSDRHIREFPATAECLLKQPMTVEESCKSHVAAAEKARGSEA